MLLVPVPSFIGTAALTSLTFVASGVGSGATITIPVAGRVAGNLCVILNGRVQGGGNGLGTVTPSGFTAREDTASDRRPGVISTKILDGTETTVTGIADDEAQAAWVVLVFQPDAPISGLTWTGNSAQDTTNVPAQTIAGLGKTTPCVSVGHMCGDTAITRTISPAMTEVANTAPTTDQYAHYLIDDVGETPGNISYDMTGGRELMQSGVLEVS